MEIKFKILKNILYIYLYGELDDCTSKLTKENLDSLIDSNLYVNKVVINLSSVNFMDSTGLGVMIGRYKKLKNLRIPLFIESPTVQIEKIFELSGIYQIIPKY